MHWNKNHIVWTGSTVSKLPQIILRRRMWYEFWRHLKIYRFRRISFFRSFSLYLRIESYCKYWQSMKVFNLSFQRYTRQGYCILWYIVECVPNVHSLPFQCVRFRSHMQTHTHACTHLRAYVQTIETNGVQLIKGLSWLFHIKSFTWNYLIESFRCGYFENAIVFTLGMCVRVCA